MKKKEAKATELMAAEKDLRTYIRTADKAYELAEHGFSDAADDKKALSRTAFQAARYLTALSSAQNAMHFYHVLFPKQMRAAEPFFWDEKADVLRRIPTGEEDEKAYDEAMRLFKAAGDENDDTECDISLIREVLFSLSVYVMKQAMSARAALSVDENRTYFTAVMDMGPKDKDFDGILRSIEETAFEAGFEGTDIDNDKEMTETSDAVIALSQYGKMLDGLLTDRGKDKAVKKAITAYLYNILLLYEKGFRTMGN